MVGLSVIISKEGWKFQFDANIEALVSIKTWDYAAVVIVTCDGER